ncbi:MAG: ABC transporter permease [Balneolales bacterium]
MSLLQTILVASGALASNKSRASLTLLAIVVGVFAVISSTTAVKVIDNFFAETMAMLGSEVINVTTRTTVQMGGSGNMRGRQPIRFDDFERLEGMSYLAGSLSPQATFRYTRVRYDDKQTEPDIRILGSNQHYIANNSFTIAEGRNLTENDIRNARPVCLIGEDVRQTLFDRENALGKRLSIDGQYYTVVGVIGEKGSAFGSSMDDFVLAAYSKLNQVYGKNRNIDIQARSASITLIIATMDELTGNMRVIRGIPPGNDNDFELETNDTLRGSFDSFTQILYLFGLVVGGIALFGAGIGVMNIMLVSVTERTKEIGLRKAVGANKRVIVQQFLAEAVIICQIGGLIGIILGVLGGNALVLMMDASLVFPVGAVVAGFLGMSVIGVIFGVYPAYKAAQLSPIDSLRYE